MLRYDMTVQTCLEGLQVRVVCAEVRPQRSAAEVRRELQSREEARNNVKLVWSALAALASGFILDSPVHPAHMGLGDPDPSVLGS